MEKNLCVKLDNYQDFLTILKYQISWKYRVAHEKPARRLVEQRGRRSRTLYRKLNKYKFRVLTS